MNTIKCIFDLQHPQHILKSVTVALERRTTRDSSHLKFRAKSIIINQAPILTKLYKVETYDYVHVVQYQFN